MEVSFEVWAGCVPYSLILHWKKCLACRLCAVHSNMAKITSIGEVKCFLMGQELWKIWSGAEGEPEDVASKKLFSSCSGLVGLCMRSWCL